MRYGGREMNSNFSLCNYFNYIQIEKTYCLVKIFYLITNFDIIPELPSFFVGIKPLNRVVPGLSPPAVTKQDACSFYLLVRHVVKFKSAALLAVGNNHPTGFQLKPQAVAAASSLRNARVGTQRFSPKKVILSSMNTNGRKDRTRLSTQLQ